MLLFERTKKYACEDNKERYPDGISPLLASLLYARGAKTKEEMLAFLYPSLDDLCDPFLLNDMDKAKARVEKAIQTNEHICIYGDYDVDGMCAASILFQALKKAGASVSYFIPTRKDDGYGMSEHTVRNVAQRGTKLIITVDNGIKSLNEIELCRELGIDVVVTDHHMCGEELPVCEAVVCHTVHNSVYPNDDICGAGTALKLVHALFGAEEMKKYIPLAGIATIADVVPLTGENRVIVAFALKMLAACECSIGVSTLLEKAVGKKDEYTTADISFGFAPRLNAAGRMESANMGVELLCSEDAKEAEKIAQKLNELNMLRQDEEASICKEVIETVECSDLSDTCSIILKSDKWHPGVIGIAASRITEKYYRPALLFSQHDGFLTGSARSVPDVDIYNALEKAKSHFVRFGGHAYAAGVTLEENADIDELHKAVDKAFFEQNHIDMFIPRKFYEIETDIDDITVELVREINMLAPFGTANPSPVFFARKVIPSKLKRVGKDGAHLSMLVHGGKASLKSIAFSMGDRFDEVMDSESIDILYSPSLDTFGGRCGIQLKISALRKSDISDAEAYFAGHSDDFKMSLLSNICSKGSEIEKKTAKADAVFGKIKEKAWGTLVLCFTEKGCVQFQNELTQRGLLHRTDTFFFGNRETPCPYNTAVFAPVLDKLKISRYKNIVIYDKAPFDGMVHEISGRAKNAEIVFCESDENEWLSSIKHTARLLFKGRDGIIPYYRMMKEAGPMFYNEEELTRKLMDRVDNADECACRFAVKVCTELGFLQTTKTGGVEVVLNPTKCELDESTAYAAIKALAE